MRRTLVNGLLAASVAVAFLLLGIPRMFHAGQPAPLRAAPEDVTARDDVSREIVEHVRRALDGGWLVSIFVSKGAPVVTATPRGSFADPERWLNTHRGELNRDVFRHVPAAVDWRPVLVACAEAARHASWSSSDAPPAMVDLRVDSDGVLHLLPFADPYTDPWVWVEAFEELDRAFAGLFPGRVEREPLTRRVGPHPLGATSATPPETPHTAARFLASERLVVFCAGTNPTTGETLGSAERAAVLKALSAAALDT